MVMAQELYAHLTPNPLHLPNNPGPNAVYVRPVVVPDPSVPLTWAEQATIDMTFARQKNYYRLMVNIKCACFTAIDACINNAFKVSNDSTI